MESESVNSMMRTGIYVVGATPTAVYGGAFAVVSGLATDTSITATLTGWTKLGPSSTGCQVWMKIADGTEGATEVATWSGAQPCGRGYAARFTLWDGSSYDSSTTSSFSGTSIISCLLVGTTSNFSWNIFSMSVREQNPKDFTSSKVPFHNTIFSK
jgi:hypothetical protein